MPKITSKEKRKSAANYTTEEQRVQEAIEYKRAHPNASSRWLADQFNTNRSKLQRRFRGLPSKSMRDATNTKLSLEQDDALCQYLRTLYDLGIPLSNKRIIGAANEILATTAPPNQEPKTVGGNWASRWLQRHSEFVQKKEKSIELERQKAMDTKSIQDFFSKYEQAPTVYAGYSCKEEAL